MVDLIRKFISIKYGQVIIDNTENADELMSIEYIKWNKDKYRLDIRFTQNGIVVIKNAKVS